MTSVLAPPPAELRPQPGSGSTRGFAWAATLLGLLGFLISFAGSWQPSFWGDEAASVMSAERSLPSLFRMLGHVDAVHGTYYLFLHFWINAFGASELSARLPSAIAIGLATAGTAVLARVLVNARVAVVAALVFAVLPRVTFMGAEARSTAAATAIAVWLTILLVRALRTRTTHSGARFGLWAAYAVVLAAGVCVFLDLALLLAAHALAVLLFTAPPQRRREAARWAAATLAGLALASPVISWSVGQSQQIAFIGREPQAGVVDVAVIQWFDQPPIAIVAWAMVVLAVVTVFGNRRGARTSGHATRSVLAVMLAWMLGPTVALLIGTHLITPMYAHRYLSFCTPAVAIVIAIGTTWFRRRGLQVAAVALLVTLAVPSYLAQRGEFGTGSDWRVVAELVRARANPGDALVFDESVRASVKPRLALHTYPTAFRGLRDVTLDRSFSSTDGLWDTTIPLASASPRLAGTKTVWLLQNTGSRESTDDTDIRTLQQLGFTVASATTVHRTIIIELTR